MSIAKVIERKNQQVSETQQKKAKELEIISMFRAHVASKVEELETFFPYVIIGENCDNILGLSYSASRTTFSGGKSVISTSTYNIVMGTIQSVFNIGYGADTASGKKKIPYSVDMTKVQLIRLFDQIIEALVSDAYSFYRDQEWKARKK